MTNDSTRTQARLAGLLYLVPMFLGPFSMLYVPKAIVVPHDPAATASKLLASETLFRMGLLSDAAIFLTEVALTAVLYILLRTVSRTLALTAAYARLAMVVIQAVNLLPHIAALALVGGGDHLSGLAPGQAQALAFVLLDLHVMGAHVWELFFALHCVLLGVLVARSGLFPKALGVLLVVAAAGYALNGIGNLAAPAHAPVFEAIVGITALVGEVPFVLWLVFRGVRSSPSSAPALA